jgi:glycosyltransferase involved in cell wall biosynthesis
MLSDFPRNRSEITGGVDSAAYNLVDALATYTDASVTALAFGHGVSAPETHDLVDGRVRLIRVPQEEHGLNTVSRYYRQRKVVGRIIETERPDLVHAQSEGFYATLAVHSGLPNVYTVHGVGLKEVELQRDRVGALRSFLRANMIRAHHRRATHIIAINNYTQNAVAPLHHARVWLIPNAVDESFFELDAGQVEPGRILIVGGVSLRKDTATALRSLRRALADVPDLRLDIVGPIVPEYEVTLRAQLDDPRLAGHVHVHGLVSSEELRALYETADIFLLTSVEESSPIAIVEAMAAGKPIVATDVGGVAEMIEAGVNGTVCPVGDDEAIAGALVRLSLERELRDRFGAASRTLAAARWSARAVARATYDAYTEIVA